LESLFQAYFTAFLVLLTLGAPLNPGNPYIRSKTEIGFDTGGACIRLLISSATAATLLWLVGCHFAPGTRYPDP
jgi:hypothetical protein